MQWPPAVLLLLLLVHGIHVEGHEAHAVDQQQVQHALRCQRRLPGALHHIAHHQHRPSGRLRSVSSVRLHRRVSL
jgi:hypothetical protein